MNWVEVFDLGLGSWVVVSSLVEMREKWMYVSVVVEGKIYVMVDWGGVVFDSGSGEWVSVLTEFDMGWRGWVVVVDGVLYCYDYLGKIRGFDVGENMWKELKGVDKGLFMFLCGVIMVNVGGRLVVVWERKGNGS